MQEVFSYSHATKEFSYPRLMDRARELILRKSEAEGDKLAVWSKALGRNHAYLYQWIHKNTPRSLPEFIRHKLAEITDIPEDQLRGPELKKLKLPSRPRPKPKIEDFRFLGAYDQAASAGPGSFINDGNSIPMHHLAFRRDWLREITSAGEEDLFVLVANGNSMAPTINDKDTMLVDKTQVNPRKDGIYVFMWDGLLNVKRLTSNPATKTISITSDNPTHDSFPGEKPENIEVVGRVIWIGRKV